MTTIEANESVAWRRVARGTVEGALEAFGNLSIEERADLKAMINEFFEAKTPEDKNEITVSILELFMPPGYFSVESANSLDEWIEDRPDIKNAVKRLSDKKTAFAAIVEKLRNERSITQEGLANQLGITQPTYSAIASGRHKPQPKTLRRLAEVLGVEVEDLWPSE